MVFRLIIVDPRPNVKSGGFATPKGRRDKSSLEDGPNDLPVMINTFSSKQTGKVQYRSKIGITKKKVAKPTKETKPNTEGKRTSHPHSSSSGHMSSYSDGNSHLESWPQQSKDKNTLAWPQRPITFVSSVADACHLEYASSGPSSFEFDGKKPQRPLFRINNPKLRKNVTKTNGRIDLSNVIDPNFAFSHNSLNDSGSKSTKQQPLDFGTNPIFKVPLNNR
ncbi:LAME_0C02608g1_1 [Lachancea meyersii CBS 8951]|uniref:LAME_0C02608g1_1 n=1 Tax=Lachancea meyersii CBS 8951 TaxID=1266667 RepID=A0A1G4IZW7_9SACH|nr:LAME_0C02608g1_1 [Lachancea meyersii CBS 8951]